MRSGFVISMPTVWIWMLVCVIVMALWIKYVVLPTMDWVDRKFAAWYERKMNKHQG